MRARVLSVVLFLIAAAAFAQPCPLTAPGFARIDGIHGGATDQCHKGEVQLLTAPIVREKSATIVKAQDIATPKLILEAATGHHIASMTLTTFDPSNTGNIVI